MKLCFLLLIGMAGALACCSVASAAPNPPADYTGRYTIVIAGFWTGEGDATVGAGSVRITATVKDDSGQVGSLVTGNLKLVDNHFSGTGTVLGMVMTVDGRVDPADPPSTRPGQGRGHNVISNARLVATFNAGEHAGRIAGSPKH